MAHPDEQVGECYNPTHITNCNGAYPECQYTVNDLAKSGPKGKTKPVESAHPTISNKLEELKAEGLRDAEFYLAFDDEGKAKLSTLIHKEVLAGRIDELKETVMSSNRYPSDTAYTLYPFYVVEERDVNDRIAELTKLIDLENK